MKIQPFICYVRYTEQFVSHTLKEVSSSLDDMYLMYIHIYSIVNKNERMQNKESFLSLAFQYNGEIFKITEIVVKMFARCLLHENSTQKRKELQGLI